MWSDKIMVLQIAQHIKFCSEFGIVSKKIFISSGSIVFVTGVVMSGRLGLLGNFWHKPADQSSLEDQDKQQISFLVICFTVKYSDRLVVTAALKVLDF